MHIEVSLRVKPFSSFYLLLQRNFKAALCVMLEKSENSVKSEQGSYVSPLAGKLFVLVGAGGAGRAIAFGARSRGARVVIFNRNFGKKFKNSIPF